MSEEDDAEYRRRLSAVLTEHGFDWVVAQAESEIAEGRPSAKQVAEQEVFSALADPNFRLRRPRATRASLITSEPYTETERLEILLKAIDAALIQRATLERAVLNELHDVNEIHFEPDAPAEDVERSYLGKPHELNADRTSSAVEIETRAREAIGALRGPGRDRTG